MTVPINPEVVTLKIGDQIEVYGARFILTGLALHHDKPAVVTFQQPVEMLEVPKT